MVKIRITLKPRIYKRRNFLLIREKGPLCVSRSTSFSFMSEILSISANVPRRPSPDVEWRCKKNKQTIRGASRISHYGDVTDLTGFQSVCRFSVKRDGCQLACASICVNLSSPAPNALVVRSSKWKRAISCILTTTEAVAASLTAAAAAAIRLQALVHTLIMHVDVNSWWIQQLSLSAPSGSTCHIQAFHTVCRTGWSDTQQICLVTLSCREVLPTRQQHLSKRIS